MTTRMPEAVWKRPLHLAALHLWQFAEANLLAVDGASPRGHAAQQ
jgi:hypothetical protein